MAELGDYSHASTFCVAFAYSGRKIPAQVELCAPGILCSGGGRLA